MKTRIPAPLRHFAGIVLAFLAVVGAVLMLTYLYMADEDYGIFRRGKRTHRTPV